MPDSLHENAVRLPTAACPGCGASAELATPEHRADPDGAVTCVPESGCCPLPHHHGKAAMACPRGHGACGLEDCAVLTPAGEPCPGGHCGLGVGGCTVCRPLVITAYAYLSGEAV
jgi:hypothetical protein